MKRPDNYLSDLARFVPVLTGPQFLIAYGLESLSQVHRILRADKFSGLITYSVELILPRTTEKPIATITPGQVLPCPHKLAYLAKKSWSGSLVPTLVIRGTAKLAALYGGQYREVVAANLSHEVALTDIFLFSKRALNPDFEWTLVLARPGAGALPDAIAADAAIEVLGRYSGATVAAKLGIAAGCTLELW